MIIEKRNILPLTKTHNNISWSDAPFFITVEVSIAKMIHDHFLITHHEAWLGVDTWSTL